MLKFRRTLGASTLQGDKVVNLEGQDIGKIEVGYQADIACFTLDELRFSGAGDPIAALVLCGAHRADRVMIAGQWRVTDGVPVGVDLARLRDEHGRAALAFLANA